MEVLQFREQKRPPQVRCRCGNKEAEMVCHICGASLCKKCERSVLYDYGWQDFPSFLVWDRLSYRYVGHFMRWWHHEKLPKKLSKWIRYKDEPCFIYCKQCAAERFTTPNGAIFALCAFPFLALAYWASEWHPFWLSLATIVSLLAFIDQERLRRARTLPPRFFILLFLMVGIPLVIIVESTVTAAWATWSLSLLWAVALPALYSWQEKWRRRPPPRSRLLPMQIIPKKAKVVVEEKVRGVCELTAEGQYKTEVRETQLMGEEERSASVATGKIIYSTQIADNSFQKAKRHLTLYRNQLPKFFVIGFAVLRGAIAFRRTVIHERETGDPQYSVVSDVDKVLHGCVVFEELLEPTDENGVVWHRYWHEGDLRGVKLGFEQVYTYEFDQKIFPFQLIPYLVTEIEEQGKETWGVEFFVRVHPKLQQNPAYKKMLDEEIKITSLKVRPCANVPPLQYATPPNQTAKEGEIMWGTISFDKKEGQTKSIYMKFEESNLSNLEDLRIEGEVTAEFKGSVSSLKEIELYGANSVKRVVKREGDEDVLEAEVAHRLVAVATFDFVCAELAVRRRIQYKREDVFNVPPTHILVTRLIDKLNESDFYVKIVTEKRPELDRDDSYIIKRYWLIVLRYYVDLYPIDIDLVISGREYSTVQQQLSQNPRFPDILAHTGDQTTLVITARATIPVKVLDIPLQEGNALEARTRKAADEVMLHFQQLAIESRGEEHEH